MKVVFVHDWLIHMRGGEKVLEALAEIYPDAAIYTLFYDRSKLSPSLQKMKIRASFLQYVPGIRKFYRWLLPFFPWIIQSLKMEQADLVISSSHCVAKGIDIPKGARHICYIHTPMRYLWGFEEVYFGKFPLPMRVLIGWIMKGLKNWDLRTNQRVDLFIANSENVRKRIREFYGKDAKVVYPPLDQGRFKPTGAVGDYYLVVSAFVPYKKVDIVIESFNRLDRRLLIVGSGPLKKQYQRLRTSANIFFLETVHDADLQKLYAEAKAVIFPTDEDFGIVPLEAQACGTPVIAYRKGGALESVQYGVFFDEQTPESLGKALIEFETKVFDRGIIPASVERFAKPQFKKHVTRLIRECLNPNFKVSDDPG